MEVTQEKIQALIDGAKRVAMENRERTGFSGGFTPVAIIVGPNGESTVQPMNFRNFKEKAILMAALSQAARAMNVLAIVLVNDTFHCNSKKISERYGLDPKLSYEDFKKAYLEILNTQFDGSLKNAPKELVSDALCISMKSPLFKQQVCFLPYHEGVGDSIRWDEEQPEMESEILMLDDWWDSSPTN